jgi:D-aminopeptidase
VATALAAAREGAIAVGCVGAGAGTICCGWKGGIGSASRKVGKFTLGVLVQTNFGGQLRIAGAPVAAPAPGGGADQGSCAIVIATDAPVGARNLRRLAARAFAGMARTGASFSNGSGDYAIAFSTAAALRRGPGDELVGGQELGNEAMSALFVAVADATEEAIIDSLCAAETTTSNGVTVRELPLSLPRGR